MENIERQLKCNVHEVSNFHRFFSIKFSLSIQSEIIVRVYVKGETFIATWKESPRNEMQEFEPKDRFPCFLANRRLFPFNSQFKILVIGNQLSLSFPLQFSPPLELFWLCKSRNTNLIIWVCNKFIIPDLISAKERAGKQRISRFQVTEEWKNVPFDWAQKVFFFRLLCLPQESQKCCRSEQEA